MSTPLSNSISRCKVRPRGRRRPSWCVRGVCWALSAWFACVSVGVPMTQASCCGNGELGLAESDGRQLGTAGSGRSGVCRCSLSSRLAKACCCQRTVKRGDSPPPPTAGARVVERATCGVARSCCSTKATQASARQTAKIDVRAKSKAPCCSKELSAPTPGGRSSGSPNSQLPAGLASFPANGGGRVLVEIDQCGCASDVLPGIAQHREPRSLAGETFCFRTGELSFLILLGDERCPLVFPSPPVPPPRLRTV